MLIGFGMSWFLFQKPLDESLKPTGIIQNPTVQNHYLKEYSLPAGTGPNGLIADTNGTVWITSSKTGALYNFDEKLGKLEKYEVKGDLPYFVSGSNSTMVWTMGQGKEGTIWFSPLGTASIWMFNPADHTFRAFQSPTGSAFQMKVDKGNGNVWFTTLSGNTLDVVENNSSAPNRYKIKSFDLGNGTAPAGLFLQNDTLWVSEITAQKIVKFHVDEENGQVSGITKVEEIPPDDSIHFSSPTDIVVSNESIWLTEHETSFLTLYNLTNNEVVRYPTSQNAYHATTLPFWIRPIAGGKYMWFNEHEGNKLALFDAVNKTMTEYSIPSRPSGGYLTYPLNIATDPLDNMILWFSEWNTDKLGRIDGHVKVPFSISADTNKVVLNPDASKAVTINLIVNGQSPSSLNKVYLNASSTMTAAAGFENADVSITPNSLDLSSDHKAELLLRDYSATPGNYTLGISVSNGIVTKTIFLGLVVPKT